MIFFFFFWIIIRITCSVTFSINYAVPFAVKSQNNGEGEPSKKEFQYFEKKLHSSSL